MILTLTEFFVRRYYLMGGRERTVGGGQATAIADNWNQFLNQQLRGTPGTPARPDLTPDEIDAQISGLERTLSGMGGSGVNQATRDSVTRRIEELRGWKSGAPQTSQNGTAPQQSEFQRLFQNMASGNLNDPSGAFARLQQMISGGGNTSERFTNPYESQTYQGPNINQLATNLFAGQTGMADLSNVGRVKDTNVNVMQGFGGQPGTSGMDAGLQQVLARLQGGQGPTARAERISLDPAKQIDLNDPLVAAMQQGVQRSKMIDIANSRARFGAEGAGSLGTGAQVAEGTLAAEYAPREAAILQDAIRFQQQQDLAERSAKAGIGIQSAGQGLQASMANAGNALQSQQSALQGLLSGRGQDLNQLIANRGLDVNQLGMGLNQAQGNQNTQLQMRGQDLTSMLQNQSMGNNFGLSAAEINQRNAQLNNTNSLAASGEQNRFNLANAGNTAQYGLGTNQLNAGQGQFDQNQLMQMIQMGLGQNNLGQGQQAQLLQMIFGGMQQSNALGTPQTQTSQGTNPWMQSAQVVLSLIGQWLQNRNSGGGGGQGQSFGTSSPVNMPTFDWQRMEGQQPTTTYGRKS